MGRQIQIAMNRDDEQEFISFLRTSTDIQIFETFAPTFDLLWVDDFKDSLGGHWFYNIWNKEFEWIPEYGTVGNRAHNPDRIGWSYISNTGTAPILEFSRSNVREDKIGRLYWAKDFSAAHGLSYDVNSFSRWIDKIWRWVRKHGKKVKDIPVEPYLLPGALHDWNS